jgi:hypothetical protein
VCIYSNNKGSFGYAKTRRYPRMEKHPANLLPRLPRHPFGYDAGREKRVPFQPFPVDSRGTEKTTVTSCFSFPSRSLSLAIVRCGGVCSLSRLAVVRHGVAPTCCCSALLLLLLCTDCTCTAGIWPPWGYCHRSGRGCHVQGQNLLWC